MKNLIDSAEELMKLTDEELNETLLDPKYNNANLRELVRRTLIKTKEYKTAFEYQLSVNEKLEKEQKTVRSEYSSLYE